MSEGSKSIGKVCFIKTMPVVTITLFAVSTLLGKGTFIAAGTGILSPKSVFACYLVSVALLVVSLILIVRFARHAYVVGLSIILAFAIFFTLNQVDPVAIAFHRQKMQMLADLSHHLNSEFKVFPFRESMGFPAGATWEYFIFDAADQINRPVSQRSIQWEKLHGGYTEPATSSCIISVRELGDHFYYVFERC